MRIRELLESKNYEKSLGICFGRFNPPHKGHASLWEDASSCDYWYVGTNEHTQDAKNPIPYNAKVKCMEAVYPKIEGHIIPSKRVFELASAVYSKHGSDFTLKVYTDEDWLVENLQRYNGVESKHGYYKFNSIEHITTKRLSSATSLREAVAGGDRAKFELSAGISADTPIIVDGKSVKFFDLVSTFLKEYKS